MIASTQITNNEILTFMSVLVLKLLSRKVLFTNRKENRNLKSRLFFKKIANFTGKVPQNHKYLECETFIILFKHVCDQLSVLFQFT